MYRSLDGRKMSEIKLSPTPCTVDHHGGLADTVKINQMLNTITPDWPEWSIKMR